MELVCKGFTSVVSRKTSSPPWLLPKQKKKKRESYPSSPQVTAWYHQCQSANLISRRFVACGCWVTMETKPQQTDKCAKRSKTIQTTLREVCGPRGVVSKVSAAAVAVALSYLVECGRPLSSGLSGTTWCTCRPGHGHQCASAEWPLQSPSGSRMWRPHKPPPRSLRVTAAAGRHGRNQYHSINEWPKST